MVGGVGDSPRLTYSAIADNPEGGQAAKVSIYEKDCSNVNLKLNSFANLSITPVPPKGDNPEK